MYSGPTILTYDEIKEDVRQGVSDYGKKTVEEFVAAVGSGELSQFDPDIRELLAWIKAVPEYKGLVASLRLDQIALPSK